MNEIIVRRDGERWGAFYKDKRIVGSGCRECIVKALVQLTKQSQKYKLITIMNEDGTPSRSIVTGVS